jgi:hypothetical protein
VNPLGGHIGSDGDGLGPKQPELFDIHVMVFCGDPESTVDGLARFFAIDRAAAARLVEETPVVVKRAAEPDVAAEMLDVLGTLGAQVVLLPAASAVPSETDLLELKEPSVAPPAPAAPRNQSPGATWGALEPMAAPEKKRAPRAATVDLIAAAPMAELELSPSSVAASSETRAAAKSAATLLEARAPTRSAPPSKRGVIDEDLVIAPLYEPGETQARSRKQLDVNSVSLPPALASTDSLPPALGEPVSSVPPAPVVQTLPPVRASVPDLGLGSVPPLPALGAPGGPPPVPGAAMRGGPARVPPPSPRPARPQPPPPPGAVPTPAQQRAQYERTLDTDASLKLPSLGVSPATGAQAAAAKPAGGDNYWSGRRAATGATLELGEVEAVTAPAKLANQPVVTGGAPGEALRDVPMRPIRANTQQTEAVRSRSAVRAALEIGAGMVVFVIFMQSNNSILLGNADVIAIVMHGFAIFGIGAGVLELRG